jgi:hypothetical protein
LRVRDPECGEPDVAADRKPNCLEIFHFCRVAQAPFRLHAVLRRLIEHALNLTAVNVQFAGNEVFSPRLIGHLVRDGAAG